MHLRVRILTTQPASPSQTAIFAGRGFVNVIATRGTPRSQGRDHCDRLRVRVASQNRLYPATSNAKRNRSHLASACVEWPKYPFYFAD